ncbi:MAG TPA: hypothetical protein VMB19_02435 [Silvibacterium sp.]|nr:hypothetical protein [Silvibacterium sp.]
MIKRGIIVQGLVDGAFLLNVDGIEIPFTLAGTWKSTLQPQPGLPVEIEFHANGAVSSVAAAPVLLPAGLASPPLSIAGDAAAAFGRLIIERVGLATVIATGTLTFSWFFLTTISYDAGFLGHINFTFWRLLGFLGSSSPVEAMQTMKESGGPGLFGFFACLVLVCPFAGAIWNDNRTALGGVFPLIFLSVASLAARSSLNSLLAGVAPEVADAAREEILQRISFGFGAYVSVVAALYLSFMSVRRFMASRAVSQPPKSSN